MGSSKTALLITPYTKQLEGVVFQFQLLRFSLSLVNSRRFSQFLDKEASKTIAGMDKNLPSIQAYLEKLGHPKDVIEQVHGAFESAKQYRLEETKRAKRARTRTLRYTAEFTQDRLNQSELLLLVAHFESFMKIVHERILYAAPAKVFGKGFRDEQKGYKVPLKDFFPSEQECWNPEKFLKELIAKEVKYLDAEPVGKRVAYFEKKLGISIGSEAETESLKRIMKLRNQISHEIYEHPMNQEEMLKERLGHGKQPPLVGDPTLEKARNLFLKIPTACIEQAAKIYPTQFKA